MVKKVFMPPQSNTQSLIASNPTSTFTMLTMIALSQFYRKMYLIFNAKITTTATHYFTRAITITLDSKISLLELTTFCIRFLHRHIPKVSVALNAT